MALSTKPSVPGATGPKPPTSAATGVSGGSVVIAFVTVVVSVASMMAVSLFD